MVHIRGDHINFDNYTLFELIESYWVDMFKFQHDWNWRYYWWKIEFRHNLIGALSKKWAADLPNFYMVIKKINNLCEDFNQTNYLDDKLYFEKLEWQSKKRKKRERRQKWHKKFFQTVKNHCFFLFFFFYPLKWANNLQIFY